MSKDSSGNDSHDPDDGHRNHQKLYHWVYVAGWCILSAAIDFGFFWPESHGWALLALAALLSLPVIYELTVLGFRPFQVAAAVGALFALAGIAYLYIGPIPPPKYVGWLQPANEPTPPNPCDNMPQQYRLPDMLLLLVGKSGFTSSPTAFVSGWPASGWPAVQIGNCEPISIKTGPNGIMITARFYDRNGNDVGSIKDNGYEISGENIVVDRSGDLSTLVVHGKNRDELLYARYINQSTIRNPRDVFVPDTPHDHRCRDKFWHSHFSGRLPRNLRFPRAQRACGPVNGAVPLAQRREEFPRTVPSVNTRIVACASGHPEPAPSEGRGPQTWPNAGISWAPACAVVTITRTATITRTTSDRQCLNLKFSIMRRR